MIDSPNTETASGEPPTERYAISDEAAERSRRSLAVVIYSRQCYMCRGDEGESITADWRDFMETICAHCSGEADYLLPDTPMKEAIFRTLLARGNAPMTAEEISDELSLKWAMTQFQRDTSPRVVKRLLDSAVDYYCIAAAAGEG